MHVPTTTPRSCDMSLNIFQISGFVFSDTTPYKFPIKEGALQRGVQIGISGRFSGEYLAIARASFRTNNNDTIFRVALRFGFKHFD